MKGYYRLLNHEWGLMVKGVGLLALLAFGLPIVLMFMQGEEMGIHSVHPRYEDLYQSSGGGIVFGVCLIGAVLLFVKTMYAGYWGGKSIYTYLTLPVKREAYYFAKLSVFMLSVLLLITAQLMGAWWGYYLITGHMARSGLGEFVMTDGLFLAFIRSEFFRLLLPVSTSGLLFSAVLWVTVVTGTYYTILCERSRKYWGYVPVVLAGWCAVQLISRLLAGLNRYFPMEGLYLYSAVLLVLVAFFVWHGLRLVKKGSIV